MPSAVKLSLAKKFVGRVYVCNVNTSCETRHFITINQEGLFMKERFSKMLMTSLLAVVLGTSMSNLSADEVHSWVGQDRFSNNNGCFDRCYDSCDYFNNCCEPRFAIWADFLYWDACQDGLDVAIIDNNNLAGVTISDGETKFFEYRYKPGFRVGASYRLPCEDLSIDFVYTSWHPKQHHTYTAPLGGTLDATTIPAFYAGGSYVEAQAENKVKYELYDLVFSKTYSCGDCSKLRPYFGGRVLWLRQKFAADYIPAVAAVRSASLWRTDLPAGGFTIGAEGKYHVCGCWSFTGRLGASILGGRVKHHNQWFTDPTGVTDTPANSGSHTEHRHHCQVVSGWDAAVGLAYDWCCCGTPVGVAVGYEIQDWWNMPQRPRFVNSSGGNGAVTGAIEQVTSDSNSRFTVHGLYVRAGIAF